jgi:hypothetical protein
MAARRGRGPLLAAALVLTAVAASAAASAALSEPPEPPAADRMREEIDDMVASGVPADDPKVEMLEEAAADLEGADTSPPRDPGAAGVGERIAAAEAADAAGQEGVAPSAAPADGARTTGAAPAPAWESGPVLCEVVPGQLGADEIAGALCASVPQPDGTDRYVAVTPDGTVRTVLFGADGVRRLGDVSAGTPVPAGSSAQATPDGHLALSPAGAAPVTVDLP